MYPCIHYVINSSIHPVTPGTLHEMSSEKTQCSISGSRIFIYGSYEDTRIVRKELFSGRMGRLYRVDGGILVDYGYYGSCLEGEGSDMARHLWLRHVIR